MESEKAFLLRTELNHMEVNVKAVLIGSSNQSFSTYFKLPITKGEADILIIDSNAFNSETFEDRLRKIYNSLNDNDRQQTALMKEISNNKNILYDIFRTTVKINLRYE